MATLREIYDQAYVADLVTPNPMTKSAFTQSGAVQSSGVIQTLLGIGQQKLEIPYLIPIDENVEPFYSNEVYTDIAVPEGIQATKMSALVAYMNKSWYEASLTRFVAQNSPLELIANYIDSYWQTNMEHRLIATLVGVRTYDFNNGKKITLDKNNTFTVNDFIEAEGTMAPEFRGSGAMVVHPAVATQMRLAKLLIPFQDPATLTTVEVYNGRRVIESTEGTTAKVGTTAKYISYLLNQGSFIGEAVAGNDDGELDRNALRANGGGTTVLVTRKNIIIHPTGFDFVANPETLTGGTTNQAISASWADLQKGDNWALATGIKVTNQVPFRIIVNNVA